MSLRVWALASLGLLALFHGLRLAAAQCQGAACDIYIPISALLPALVLVSVAVTAVLALRASRGRAAWSAAAVAGGALSVLGPPLALAELRDNPDLLVPVATALFAIEPLLALAYSFATSATEMRPRA